MRFARLQLPDLWPGSSLQGRVPELPELPPELFAARFARLEQAREAAGFDCLAIYADREHSANLEWLSGFAPRFEEALWLQPAGRRPTLLVGNENLDYAPLALRLDAEPVLYQPLSLPGQDRSRSRDLVGLLRRAGVERGMRCGVIGWKPPPEIDLPHWLVREIAMLSGEEPVNAADLLIDPERGLRLALEPEMARLAEYAAALTSEGVKQLLFSLREGVSELEAAAALQHYGLELSCHPMVNFGRPIASGLGSPGNRRARRGDYVQTAFGVKGGLTCRAGRLIAGTDAGNDAGNDAGPDPDQYLALVENYLQVVRAWYAALAVGVSAGAVAEAAAAAKNDAWAFALNPGHLTHLEEWLTSPFAVGSSAPLRSGFAIQQDIIPAPRAGAAVINMEDGLLLADEELREQLARLDPALLQRCQARRELMLRLGYELAPEVLPLSNIAGVYWPFLLEPETVALVS